jgi:hypothetical protein
MESLQEIKKSKQQAQEEPKAGEDAQTDPEKPKAEAEATDWDINEKATLDELGLKDVPVTPATKALIAKHAQLATEKESFAARQGHLEQMLLTSDIDGLRKAGFDLPFDTRTTEDKYNEVVEYHNSVKSFADPLLDKLHELSRAGEPFSQDHYKAIFNYINDFASGISSKGEVIKREMERQQLKNEVKSEMGYNPVSKQSDQYKQLSQRAENHIVALQQRDPRALENWNYLKTQTSPGGALAAFGIDLAKAYGTSPKIAEAFNELGAALRIKSELPSLIQKEQAKWEAAQTEKAVSTIRPLGTSIAPAQGVPTASKSVSALEALFDAVAKR